MRFIDLIKMNFVAIKSIPLVWLVSYSVSFVLLLALSVLTNNTTLLFIRYIFLALGTTYFFLLQIKSGFLRFLVFNRSFFYLQIELLSYILSVFAMVAIPTFFIILPFDKHIFITLFYEFFVVATSLCFLVSNKRQFTTLIFMDWLVLHVIALFAKSLMLGFFVDIFIIFFELFLASKYLKIQAIVN